MTPRRLFCGTDGDALDSAISGQSNGANSITWFSIFRRAPAISSSRLRRRWRSERSSSPPSEAALIDVRKAATMFDKVNVPVLGLIENMSYCLSI
jgi:hypothetical protein